MDCGHSLTLFVDSYMICNHNALIRVVDRSLSVRIALKMGATGATLVYILYFAASSNERLSLQVRFTPFGCYNLELMG
jgi:hypothetical protein